MAEMRNGYVVLADLKKRDKSAGEHVDERIILKLI
jgi:hypothetical protein